MRLHRTDIAVSALALMAGVLIAFSAMAASASMAQASTLGVGDGAQFDAAPSAALGAKAYRVVIDPDLPIESYDARIAAHRAVGQEPQLVIGGTGTLAHADSRGIVRAAVAAAKRWPSAYSISVVNEPNESGMGVCEYARTWLQSYRALRAAGVRRVLFGEWSPQNAEGWQRATMTRCPNTSPALRRLAKRVAWHGYWRAIDYGRIFRAVNKRVGAVSPELYITEAGGVLHAGSVQVAGAAEADLAGLRYWRHALHVVKRDHVAEIVAWDIHSPQGGAWDSGLIDGQGRPRPAFAVIASAAL